MRGRFLSSIDSDAYRLTGVLADATHSHLPAGVLTQVSVKRSASASRRSSTARPALWQMAAPDSTAASVASELLSGLAEVTTLGSVLGALFYTGVFGIDEPARRAFVHRVLRVSIGVVLAVLAVLAGVLTSLVAPVAVAVAVAVAAGAAGQTVRPRLEHLADRWVLGARLAAGSDRPRKAIR